MKFIAASWLVPAILCSAPLAAMAQQDDIERSTNVRAVRTLEHLEIGRPICITHAGDGSGRFFIASQYGTVHVLESSTTDKDPEVFLDIVDRVTYKDRQNEEGFLGLAFHPKFKDNGKLYVYYTTNEEPQLSIVSEFSVDKDDPSKADPDSEVQLMKIKQPFWNHNGGTIKFGPDGYLYIALGDGGARDDPQGNGQNLKTLLGSILRIDVDSKSAARPYGIPKDNPFVGRDDARPEIYALGLRNVWRLSFDRKTGTGWIGEVGQDIWEEINILAKGGNYGWNLREGMHEFMGSGVKVSDKYIEPIFEYDHEVGKSITGGVVYRGKNLPELDGVYIYADYVSGKVWGLDYDVKARKINGHMTFGTDGQIAVITFGEDEQGEVFFSDAGGRIFTLGK